VISPETSAGLDQARFSEDEPARCIESCCTESLDDDHRLQLIIPSLHMLGCTPVSSSSSPEGFSKLFDRHVEMIGRIQGLWYFLAYGRRRGSRFRLSGGTHRDDWFVDNLLSMTRIAD
jgi:hypothetical protein